MKRKKIFKILVVVLFLLICVAIFLGIKKGNNGVVDNSTDMVETASNIKVETKYGDFYISDQWYDYFEYEIVDEDAYEVKFKAVHEDNEAELFTLIFAEESEKGSMMGNIEIDGVVKNVYINIEEIEIPKNLPVEKHDAFYGMQEEVNSIIEQLNQMDNYTVAE